MYNLDFDTMKQVMREHRTTGYLAADVPAGMGGLPGPCHAEVILKGGVIISCFIVGGNGLRLSERDSARQLARLGRLKWNFTPQEERIAPAPSPVGAENISFFPRRTMHVEQWQMQSWSRMHRMVFALADGTRSAGKIAEMLSAAPDQVDRALQDLQAIGVISIAPQNGMDRRSGTKPLL